MLEEPRHEMQIKTMEGRRRARFAYMNLGQGEGVGFYTSQVDSDIAVLREHLKVEDEKYREEWKIQGNEISAEFISSVVWPAIFLTISVREGIIRGHIKNIAGRARFANMTGVLRYIARKISQLKAVMRNRYDIEIMRLKYVGLRAQPAEPPSPKSEIHSLKPIELSERERKISEIIQLGSRGAQYCRELHAANLRPRRSWTHKGCPGTYPGAYTDPKWRQAINDEKSKVRRKAEVALR